MKPHLQKNGLWQVQVYPKWNTSGKRESHYFKTETAAKEFIRSLKKERLTYGKQAVTTEDRRALEVVKAVTTVDKLPEVLAHWRRTGADAVHPMPVSDATEEFIKSVEARVSRRTKADIRYRLHKFCSHFGDRQVHQISQGEIHRWLYAFEKPWQQKSMFKRLKPFFGFCLARQIVAADPMANLKPPVIPRESREIYTGQEFNKLLIVAADQTTPCRYLLPFAALSGLTWVRTSEMVRTYADEPVLCWEDFDWKRQRFFIRPEVGKQTSRTLGNSRYVPFGEYLPYWIEDYRHSTGIVVPDIAKPFYQNWRKLHETCKVEFRRNGLRAGGLSHYLAFHQDTGVGQLARWAGTSDNTIRKHYLERLTPEQGQWWFFQKWEPISGDERSEDEDDLF